MFRVQGDLYSRPNLAASTLWSIVSESKISNVTLEENGLFPQGPRSCSYFSREIETPQDNCCVCLGILQLTYNHGKDCFPSSGGGNPIDDFIVMLSEQIKKEGHQIEGFCLEISIPPVILANERAIW